jgi:hypothetical protein
MEEMMEVDGRGPRGKYNSCSRLRIEFTWGDFDFKWGDLEFTSQKPLPIHNTISDTYIRETMLAPISAADTHGHCCTR